MIEKDKLNQRIAKLEEALAAKLRLRGKGLSQRLRRAGRLLPKPVRRAVEEIVRAQSQADHPKLARLIDPVRVDRAFVTINAYLDGIDPAERRKGAILGVLGGLVLNLLLIAAALVAFLMWRKLL